jgi:ABC-type lipoprotein release transport system permease subunit
MKNFSRGDLPGYTLLGMMFIFFIPIIVICIPFMLLGWLLSLCSNIDMNSDPFYE